VEVGAGTGAFLSLFAHQQAQLVGIDLTEAMLRQGRADHPEIAFAAGDARRLPLGSHSVDLVASAQMLHHIHKPLPILNEMRRVAKRGGRVLIVDQVAPERYEEAIAMNELEITRDPTHAASRPASAFRALILATGLRVTDERIEEGRLRLSQWMWPGEFPDARMEAVRAFIKQRGSETGMEFEPDGDDYVFTRRRMALLATREAG
jgi:ubiquinone/menaquinone biosynthesis C-methylase UbiE